MLSAVFFVGEAAHCPCLVLLPQTGKLIFENPIHGGQINEMRFSVDGTHFITASTDKTAKLVDTQSLEVLKTYRFERPVNAADMSPLLEHVSIFLMGSSNLLC